MASATDYFLASSRCRMLPPAWSQAPVVMTTSHQCYGSYTGCQSVSESYSRSRGSCISRSLERLPRTLLTTIVFCQTLVIAHCGQIKMTCGSCSCREHTINLATGVSLLLVLACETTFLGSTQPCIPLGLLNRVPASAEGKGGILTSVGWQVTLCDPIWHVSFP